MKTRSEIVEELAKKGLRHNRKPPSAKGLSEARSFAKRHDFANSDANAMANEMNSQPLDGDAAELLLSLVREWRTNRN